MERTVEFILYGLVGAVLGGLIGAGGWWLLELDGWIIPALGAMVGFLLAGFLGDRGLGWLKHVLFGGDEGATGGGRGSFL